MYIYIMFYVRICVYMCPVLLVTLFVRVPSSWTFCLRTFGGTPNRDPCRLYDDYIRVIYGNGIKGPY